MNKFESFKKLKTDWLHFIGCIENESSVKGQYLKVKQVGISELTSVWGYKNLRKDLYFYNYYNKFIIFNLVKPKPSTLFMFSQSDT